MLLLLRRQLQGYIAVDWLVRLFGRNFQLLRPLIQLNCCWLSQKPISHSFLCLLVVTTWCTQTDCSSWVITSKWRLVTDIWGDRQLDLLNSEQRQTMHGLNYGLSGWEWTTAWVGCLDIPKRDNWWKWVYTWERLMWNWLKWLCRSVPPLLFSSTPTGCRRNIQRDSLSSTSFV